MKKRIKYFKENLHREAIDYFRDLKDNKNYTTEETCKLLSKKYPEYNIGESGFGLFLDGVAIMVAITELSEERE